MKDTTVLVAFARRVRLVLLHLQDPLAKLTACARRAFMEMSEPKPELVRNVRMVDLLLSKPQTKKEQLWLPIALVLLTLMLK
jgi:hypothetical protein